MKKFLLLLSVFLSTLSMAAKSTAYFTIESKPITAGETVELNVTIHNSEKTETSAFQFDLEVAEGLSFVAKDGEYFALSTALFVSPQKFYSCVSSKQADNKIRVVLYSNKNTPFSDFGLKDDFVIGTITVQAAQNFTGAASVSMDNAIIAGTGGEGGVTGGNEFQVVTPDGQVIDPKEPAADAEVYIPAKSLTLDKTTGTVAAGSSDLTITATSDPATGYPVTWTSSDEKVATVADGVVTGVSAGTATITASIAGGTKTATCTVTVTAPDPTGITLNKKTIDLKVGASETLTATIEPANSNVAKPTWSSSDETIATVDANGKVTGIKAGTATITATAKDQKATCSVTVTNVYVTKVEVDTENSSTSLKAGQTVQFHALLTGENSEPATDQTITWSLSGDNAGLATIDAVTGDVTIKSDITVDDIGKTITIIATSKAGAPDDDNTEGTEVTGEATITIVATPISKITLTIDPANGEIKDTGTAKITATIEPATATYPTVTFTIPEGATVTKQGSEDATENTLTVVAGATLGKTTITATPSTHVDGDCAGVITTVTVIATPVESITITTEPNAESMKGGTSMTFSAEVTPATATDKTITWSVDDETLATITKEGGVLTAKTGVTGSVTVTATAANGVTATKTITIIGVEVTAITVDPTEKTLAQGENVTITATLTGEKIDGKDVEPTDKTITWTAAWAADATFDGTTPAVADFVTVEDGTVNVVKVTPETATKKVVITAKPNGATTGITATCTITLAKTNVTGVSVAAPEGTAANPELKQGETIQLTATVAPGNATYQTVTWTSSSKDVTVSENGLVKVVTVTPETVGETVTITATSDDPDASTEASTFAIKLAATPVETVKVDLEKVTLLPGTKVTGNVTEVGPDNATIKTLSYTSDKPSVATIAEVTATETEPETPETPEPETPETPEASETEVNTTTEDEAGETEPVTTEPVATFTITGVAEGEAIATIKATSGIEAAKATVNVTVNNKLEITTEARKNPETQEPQVAKTRQIKYTANTTLPLIWTIVDEELKADEPATDEPELNPTGESTEEPSTDDTTGADNTGDDNTGDDNTATTKKVVAFIAEQGNDPDTGVAYCIVEGSNPGNATVTATIAAENITDDADQSSLKAEDKIEVINVIADKLTLSATKFSISKGDSKTLTATLEPEEGVEEPVSIQEVEWTVSNESVIEVVEETDLTISFKAIANGTCTITAKTVDSSDLTAECTITVAPTVTGIEAVGIDETEGANIRVYDLSGKCVATSAEQYARLGEGLYIIRTSTRTVKVLKTDAIPAGL